MISYIKKIVQRVIRLFLAMTSKTAIGRYFNNQAVEMAMEQVLSIRHNDIEITLAVPTRLSRWRVETFSSKEPETLEWIDNIPKGSVLWDIGANIGLYSVYAALKRNCKVWAFEPSVFNLEILARNIFLNKATQKICIVPVALNDEPGSSHLRMTSTQWGGACSTFGKDFGWDGKTIQQVFEFQTLGISMEDAFKKLAIPQPEYIKMDVDGIEHLILKGGVSVLKKVKGVIIEVNDDFHEQSDQCKKLLLKAGLKFKEKKHSDMFENSDYKNAYNQIWVRSR